MNQYQKQKLINSMFPILITGETGTGKSFMAKSIYEESTYAKSKFLTLHLASLKEDLIESELFGHAKGAFTGAVENKKGYFKEVGKGTLFLDEIGELSLDAQKKLLYVLEEKKFTPVGETQAYTFEGRLIFATNKNLKKMVEDNLFREDLFFRIMNFNLRLPSLKVKGKQKLETELMKFEVTNKKTFSIELRNFLLDYHWPGNYRELKNALDYILMMSQGDLLEMDLLPNWMCDLVECAGPDLPSRVSASNSVNFIIKESYGSSIEAFEKYYLNEVLNLFGGRINETARKIGISKSALIYKARKYQINTPEMRANMVLEKSKKVA